MRGYRGAHSPAPPEGVREPGGISWDSGTKAAANGTDLAGVLSRMTDAEVFNAYRLFADVRHKGRCSMPSEVRIVEAELARRGRTIADALDVAEETTPRPRPSMPGQSSLFEGVE